MAATVRKLLYLGSDGIYRGAKASEEDALQLYNIEATNNLKSKALQVTDFTASNGVLKNDGSGNISTSLVATANIDDSAVTNDKLAGSIADSKLLSGVSSSNEASKIVKRDASGNFYAGTIYAALSGNASTASKWANSRTVTFGGGDVTGSFSADGSADVSSVNLTIGSEKVTNSMLAGSISNDKLNQIASANMVADSALSNNVALTDKNSQTFTGTFPAFSNPLSVGTPTENAHATTKSYVDTALATATAGLDYKQEAKWYWDLSQNGERFEPGQATTKDGFLAGVNAYGNQAPFAAGERILLNDTSGTNADVGIWVLSGSPGSFTIARTSDMLSGSATGAWVYVLKVMGQGGATDHNTAYVCNTVANVGSPIQFIIYSKAQDLVAAAPLVRSGLNLSLSTSKGLKVDSNKLTLDLGYGVEFNSDSLTVKAGSAVLVDSGGVNVRVDDSTIQVNGSGVLALKSLPSEFKISGSATSPNVTATNLGTLTGGTTSNASALHYHMSNRFTRARGSNAAGAFSLGTIVMADTADSSKLIEADKGALSTAKPLGVVVSDNSGNPIIATSGVVEIMSDVSGTAAGDPVYLGAGGAFCRYTDIDAGELIVKVGRYMGGNRVALQFQDYGYKS